MEKTPIQKERVPENTLISEIPVIAKGGIVPFTKESLKELVEAPLLEACEELYDKNIETTSSSANGENNVDSACIVINFDTLSEENKKVALQFGKPHLNEHAATPYNSLTIEFPVSLTSTVGDIRKVAHQAVSQFHKQELTWGRTTIKDLAKSYGVAPEQLTPESFPDKYYDAQTGYLYYSEELYKKANNLI